jgi:hypothetical protein
MNARLIGIALAVLTLVAGCGDDESAATTTTAEAVTTTQAELIEGETTTTTTPATTTSEPPATTTTTTTEAPAPPPPDGAMLITNEDGVFVATLDGVVSQVLDADETAVGGIVDFAIDDTRGGIVVQPSSRPWAELGAASIVYWAAEGAGALQELLVPAADQGLKLEDVQPQGDTVQVYYTRRSGDTPETAEQTLRRFDLDEKTVTEVVYVGGWESGTSPISVGGDSIVRSGSGEAYFWTTFSDLDGNEFDSPANPMPGGEFDCVPECFYHGDLSPDGSLVAFGRLAPNANGFYTIPEVELREVASGDLIMSVTLPEVPAVGYIDSLDVSDTHVLVNLVEEGSEFPVATVIDIASGGLDVQLAPVGGVARFLRAIPDLDGVIAWP